MHQNRDNVAVNEDQHMVAIIDTVLLEIREGVSVPDLISQLTNLIMVEQESITEESKEAECCGKIKDGKIDFELLGRDGFNCLHVACGSGNLAVAQYLLTNK